MLPTTLKLVRTAFEADPSIGSADRQRLMHLLRQAQHPQTTTPEPVPRLLRRSEVARRMSYSLRMVDKLAASGVLRKHKLPGRQRAAGFLEADVNALIAA